MSFICFGCSSMDDVRFLVACEMPTRVHPAVQTLNKHGADSEPVLAPETAD